MAEVAGTIVGVISLSIQLFDQFSKYTNSVKDARKRAEQITRELDALVDLLENLETIISKVVATTAIALTKTSIHECARAIETIRARLGDALPETSSGRFWSRSRNTIKRLAYPFKEGEIKYWKEVLASIQQILLIALLASLTDQQQQHFAILQAQFDQLSLNTNAGIQMIIDQQRRAETTVNRYIMDQSQSSGVERSDDRTHTGAMQPFFGEHVHLSAGDKALGLRARKAHGTARNGSFVQALLPVSAVDLEEDMTNFRNFQRITQPLRSSRMENSNAFASCTCRKRLLRKQSVRSPFVVSRNEAHYHDTNCPFWTSRGHDVTIGFGMVLCYLILGLKLRLFMQLSIGSGTFSIMPSLSFRRIVTEESSPAFRLIRDMLYHSDGLDSLNHSTELTKIFQTRQASPHERLKDGTTLLHSFCARINGTTNLISPNSLETYQLFLDQLLSYMTYADASDTNDSGRTCVDLLLRDSSNYTASKSLFKILGSDLLRYDLRISTAIDVAQSYSSWVGISFTSFPDPFFDLSDTTVSALLRSEMDFSSAIQTHNSNHTWKQGEISKLYHMTTLMGWTRGCQILLDAHLSYTSDAPPVWSRALLLLEAVDSHSQDMVQFWLDIRKNATAECLADIGGLEYAVIHALADSQVDIAEIVAAHLIEQRHQLRQMIEKSGIECECVERSKGVLDAHATCATHALDRIGLKIMPSLRPTSVNIYNVPAIYNVFLQPDANFSPNSTLEILQFLYDAGFKDVAILDKECCHGVACSPLHLGIASWARNPTCPGEIPEFFKMIDWFLGKGADITDCWPGSKITALHYLGAKVAHLLVSETAIVDDLCDIIAKTFRHAITDDCQCSCSTHGCTSIVSFFNTTSSPYFWTGSVTPGGILGLLRLERVHVNAQDWYQKCRKFLQCVAEAAKDAANRWIITNFIRLCVFSWLGIRHTCRDIWYFIDTFPDLRRAPPLRYPPDELSRIQEEDAYLVRLLEDLVPLFDARYDSHDGDLLSFVDDVLVPEMNILLDQMKEEDEAAHAVGRREMGVVMTEEHESYVYEKHESDSADQSDDRKEKRE